MKLLGSRLMREEIFEHALNRAQETFGVGPPLQGEHPYIPDQYQAEREGLTEFSMDLQRSSQRATVPDTVSSGRLLI